MARYSLQINGDLHAVDVEPDMPLLWVLRDRLQMMGTKYGCGLGLCGACTVHVDGVAMRSCQLRAADLEGKKIGTIEGLSSDCSHPLQRAWVEQDVAQCGYCQPGQIMSAAALLRATPNPSAAEIDQAMAGNLCRCGAYLRIRGAILMVAKETTP